MLSRDSVVDEQHSVARTVVLHLLPGALITAFYVGAAPVVRSLGFPSLMAIFLAIGFVLIPFELGYLIYQARKNASTLGSVVLYRQPVPRGQFVALVLGLLAWWGICSVLLFPPLDEFFRENVFSWLPGWFLFAEDFTRYSTAALLITWTLGLVVNGIAGPVVEEMYFRGYLLPRISRLGAWAPLVNTVFFSLYHFFTPWLNVGRIIGLLPMVYAAWWKKSIYVSMTVHVLGNAIAYFKPMRDKAGVPPIHFHDLRHTYATLALLNGIPVKVVSEVLGHKDIATTLRTYAHLLPGMQAEAARTMDAVLFNRS